MERGLLKYSIDEIIAAQSAFHVQKSRHPENHYGEDYFFGILRNKRNHKAKMLCSDIFRAGVILKSKLPRQGLEMHELQTVVSGFLAEIEAEPSPLHRRYHLQELMFFLVSESTRLPLHTLWAGVIDKMVHSNRVSARWMSGVMEFAYEHLGELLYVNAGSARSASALHQAPTAEKRMGAELF